MKFGDNLRKLRKNKNISQEQLADKVNVSRQSVSKWETGEAYPEMNNILELCKIFHCKINDLVNDSIIDIESLDEEVKMSVVKFKEEKQKRVKILSKILSLIGKISKIVIRVAIGFVVVSMIVIPVLINSFKVQDDKIVSKGNLVKITELDDGFRISLKDNEHVIVADIDNKDVDMIKNSQKKYSNITLTILVELGLTVLVVFLVLLSRIMEHLEKLFTNIYNGDTPFTLDNVNHIKKMSYLMIACIVASSLGSIIFNIAIDAEDIIEMDLFNIVEIIFLYALSYIFEYGYEIQLDSKGKMYGDTNE